MNTPYEASGRASSPMPVADIQSCQQQVMEIAAFTQPNSYPFKKVQRNSMVL